MPKKPPLYPHVAKSKMPKTEPTKSGISVPGFVRDSLVSHFKIDYDKAVEFSDIIDKRLKEVDWLELYDGTTFDKTFVPEPKATRDIRPGDLVKSRVWERGTIWLTVLGGPFASTWAGQPIEEYEVTDSLRKNRVFSDTIIDHIKKR